MHLPLHALRIAVAAGLLVAGSRAQHEDAQRPTAPVLRVIGLDDGLPRPGVELVRTSYEERARTAPDGLLVIEPRTITRLRQAPWRGRTDPEGRIELEGFSNHEVPSIDARPPYWANVRAQREGDAWVLKVAEREPVGLVAVDGSGTRLAEFPMGLFGDGRELCTALTDAKGRAMLALDKGYTARVVAAPSGWIGSLDVFPTLAEGLPGKRGTTVTVPPHGTVRVRFRRGGNPCRLSLTHVWVYGEDGITHATETATFPQTECTGFELPLVALATPLVLRSTTRERWELRVPPLTKAGEVVEYAVELGPVVTFRLTGPEFPELAHVRVRLVTDTDVLVLQDLTRATREVRIECPRAISGTRLLRVEVDVQPVVVGSPQRWSLGASHAMDLSLPSPELQLGELALESQPAPLRGRVVAADGSPAAHAKVVVTAAEPQGATLLVESDHDGTFAMNAPPFRDANGHLVGARVRASLDGHASAQSDVVPFGGEVELRLDRTVPVRAPDAGTLRVVVAGTKPAELAQRHMALLSTTGIPRYEPKSVLPDGTGSAIEFEGVAKGTYSLVAHLPEFGPVVVLDELAVDGATACADERLRSPIDLPAQVRVVEVVVVDHESIPIVGARVTSRYLSRATDGTGTVRIPWNRESKAALTIEKAGMRPVRLNTVGERHVVKLEPQGAMDVMVKGLPEDVSREHLVVWVRGAERGNFEGNQAKVEDDGVAHVALPVPGSYRAVLLVQTRTSGGGRVGTAIAQTEPFAIREDGAAPVSIALDEAAIARLREEVQKAKGSGR